MAGYGFQRNVPVKIGEKIRVKVNRLTRKGDGYVRYKGFSIFIKNVDLGWAGEIEIKKLGPSFAVAEPV